MEQTPHSQRYATRKEIEQLLEETERYGSTGALEKQRLKRREKYKTPGQKFGHAVSTALYYVLIAVLCGMLFIGVRAKLQDALPTIFGYTLFTVETGSMVPTLPIGCYIIVHEAEDPAAIPSGTITTFRFEDGMIVTPPDHRGAPNRGRRSLPHKGRQSGKRPGRGTPLARPRDRYYALCHQAPADLVTRFQPLVPAAFLSVKYSL